MVLLLAIYMGTNTLLEVTKTCKNYWLCWKYEHLYNNNWSLLNFISSRLSPRRTACIFLKRPCYMIPKTVDQNPHNRLRRTGVERLFLVWGLAIAWFPPLLKVQLDLQAAQEILQKFKWNVSFWFLDEALKHLRSPEVFKFQLQCMR